MLEEIRERFKEARKADVTFRRSEPNGEREQPYSGVTVVVEGDKLILGGLGKVLRFQDNDVKEINHRRIEISAHDEDGPVDVIIKTIPAP